MRKVIVPLGERTYPVLVGSGLLSSLGKRCRELGFQGRCAVVADAQVAKHFAPAVLSSLTQAGFDPRLVPFAPGEKSKRLSVLEACLDQIAQHRLERRSLIVALGGGVTGDLAGFAAASFLRGVALIQVPTSLLAQVDSSVGGKVGVNLRAGKNLVGAFQQPRLVLCDLDTLRTLPEREFRSGLAEVIKYGIIRDAALFERLERDLPEILKRDPAILGPIVARCCAIKAEVVGQDETESGLRAILNFGHTIGHAIEAISSYGRHLHGEAISIGQVAAAHLSSRLQGLPPADAQRIQALFQRAGLPVTLRRSAGQREKLFEAMKLDKKVSGGEIRFVLTPALGQAAWGIPVPENALRDALDLVQP